MNTITRAVMFVVLLWTLWDIRRGQRITQGIVEQVEASAERIEASAERIKALAERIP
jgi:hypothetical protein